MTAPACSPHRGSGGCCAFSAQANTYVLDGGFDAWKAQGLPLETGDRHPTFGHGLQCGLSLPAR
jgi:hypothetical protein